MLRSKEYRPGKFEIFKVWEPKERLVQAPAFTDKVVLHAIVDNVLYDVLTHSFIRDNCASQIGKGTHDCLGRLKYFMQEYFRKHGNADGWVLKCDVKHFFASIDHDTLKEKLRGILEKHGVDLQIYELLCIYIDTTEGLPLGYQTSQLLALMYLDELDHLIKEKYRVRAYGRSMDDFYIIHQDKGYLQWLWGEISNWMAGRKLELNRKTAIFPLRNGIDFLGFHTYLTDTGGTVQKLRQDSIDRMKRRVKRWREEYPAGKVTKEAILKSWQAWDAHAAHGDTYALRLKYAGQVGDIIGETLEPRRKINSSKRVKNLRKAKAARKKAKAEQKKAATTKQTNLQTAGDETAPPWE